MRRKQSMQHFDQRQILLLENAYYQAGSSYLVEQLYSGTHVGVVVQSTGASSETRERAHSSGTFHPTSYIRRSGQEDD